MKKLIALILWVSALPAIGQVVYACQYSNSSGFVYEAGRWKPTSFVLKKPFFLTLNSQGLPDEKSLEALGMLASRVTCGRPITIGDAIGCGEARTAGALSFNTKTLEGAVSNVFGAAMNGPQRDTVMVELFSCQRM